MNIEATTESYPNLSAVLTLAFSFFTLFLAFNSSANSAAKSLRDAGLDNLGFYTLSMLYCTFGLGSIWAPKMVRYFNPKRGMAMASLMYAIWIGSLGMYTVALRKGFLSKEAIVIVNLCIAAICGPGCSLLWIA